MSSTLIIELAEDENEKVYDVNQSGTNIHWQIQGATGGYEIDNLWLTRGNANNYVISPFDIPCNQPCTEIWAFSVVFAVLSVFMFVLICTYIKGSKEIEIFDPSKRQLSDSTMYVPKFIDVNKVKRKRREEQERMIQGELKRAGGGGQNAYAFAAPVTSPYATRSPSPTFR